MARPDISVVACWSRKPQCAGRPAGRANGEGLPGEGDSTKILVVTERMQTKAHVAKEVLLGEGAATKILVAADRLPQDAGIYCQGLGEGAASKILEAPGKDRLTKARTVVAKEILWRRERLQDFGGAGLGCCSSEDRQRTSCLERVRSPRFWRTPEEPLPKRRN